MKKSYILLLAVALILSATSCMKKMAGPISAFAPKEIIYMNSELDGSITLRVQGEGRDEKDAHEQAAKEAVHAVIFEGVNVPNNQRLSQPLVADPRAEVEHEAFFNKFFKDGGKYTSFVSKKDHNPDYDYTKSRTTRMRVITTVRVERSKLQAYLIKHEIITE